MPQEPLSNKAVKLLPLADTQWIYEMLIGCKNEWNARVARGETTQHLLQPVERTINKAYLHFSSIGVSSCACGYPSLPGTHAEFACTITKS